MTQQPFCQKYFSGYDKEVEIALIGPYFNTKTKLRREDVYFDSHNKNRIGGKYYLEVQFLNNENGIIEYKIPLIQFIVDDELSVCLPFIEYYTYNKQ